MIQTSRLLATVALSLGALGAGCTSEPASEPVVGTWSNASVVLVATSDSVAFIFGCSGLRLGTPLTTLDGAFELRGRYDGTEMVPAPAVTVTGTVAGSTITFETHPEASPDNVGTFTVTRNGVLPDWWVHPENYLCPG